MAKTPYPQTDRELVRRIERSAGRRAGYKQLIRELGLGGGRERRLLLEQLARITARGELVKTEFEQWAVPDATPEKTARTSQPAQAELGRGTQGGGRVTRDKLVAGRLDLHRDGYGFVRPNGSSNRDDDLFIPPNELNGAMQGDEVLVDEAPPGRDGRRSGRVARVLTRRNPTVVGIFHYARGRRGHRSGWEEVSSVVGGNYVTPLDERMSGAPVLIPEGAEIVVESVTNSNRTLGEEAETQKKRWRVGETAPLGGSSDAPTQAELGWGTRQKGRWRVAETTPLEGSSDAPTQAELGWGTRGRGDSDAQGHDWMEGLAVDVEITDFPAPGRPAKGRVIEVLGPPDAFGVDVEIVIRKHHLPHVFPANVLAEASEAAGWTVEAEEQVSGAKAPPHSMGLGAGTEVPAYLVPVHRPAESIAAPSQVSKSRHGAPVLVAALTEGRRDFRGLPIVTIDGETARDFDDAVLVTPLANGNWELQVHIADVSHYVRPGTALDLEARLRGTSVYFPDRAVPMLPPQLSSGMCSLRPDEDRLVQSCVMEIDGRGEVVGYEVCEGIIRSAKRMTYTQVQAILDSGTDAATDVDKAVRAEFAEYVTNFEQMYELALKLNAKRKRRGSIDFDLPEPVIEFDPDGNMESIVKSERGWAHRLIEEFMLSANECVATWIEKNAVPSIYRIHEMPDPKRILDFEETASGFGYSLGFASLPVKQMTMKADRRDVRRGKPTSGRKTPDMGHPIVERIPVTPQMYQRLTAKIAGKPEERILAYLMLRSLKQAKYSEKNEGHFALASPCYTHFTSPIRRYPDLIVHRLLRDLIRGGADRRGGAILSTDAQPWSASHRSRRFAWDGASSDAGALPLVAMERLGDKKGEKHVAGAKAPSHSSAVGAGTQVPAYLRQGGYAAEPIPEAELAAIAVESSQAERRADDAERELMEWKKMRFMEDRVGEDFGGIVLSCTKYGFFVELDDLFIEGLVPIASLSGWGSDERFVFRDTDKQIVSTRGGRVFKMGQRVHVLLDRIDRQQRRLQFALVPDASAAETQSLRKGKAKAVEGGHSSPDRSGKKRKSGGAKKKGRLRDEKGKGKRK